jgi:hypothetical protein
MGYSPNDFFYITATNTFNMPNDNSCNFYTKNGWNDPLWDISCNTNNFQKNKEDCVNRELCFNKSMALELQNIENANNGSQMKYKDSNAIYQETMWNTGNMVFGILILSFMIYEYRKV